jgi:VanZ family protein
MKSYILLILDWILFVSFIMFIFMAMDILPAVWYLLGLISGKNIAYFPAIFIGIPLFILLFYVAFIQKQKRISSYIWYIVLVIIITQVYYMIDGPHNRMHIFLYFMLSIISFRFLRNYMHDKRLYLFGFLIATSFGVIDECLQLFSITRGFCFLDIRSDACAVLIGQLFMALVVRPDLEPWVPKLKNKIKGYYMQEKWLKKQKRRLP